ncbi:MAG: ABC transporter ATP-binding protein, partial [Phycisphaerae bacterium]
ESARSASLNIAICRIMAAVIQLAVYLTAAAAVSLKITLLALLAGSFIWLLLGRFVEMARHAGYSQSLLVRSLSAHIADSLQGIKPLKAMGLERRILPLLEDEAESLKHAIRRQTLAKHGLSILREPVIVLFVAAGLYFALSSWSLEISALLLMAVLFHRTVNAIGALHVNYQQIGAVESFFHSVRELTESAVRACEHPGHGVRSRLSRRVQMENVGFSYPDRPVLERVSLTIPAGELTALVGPSGAGKTTIADLICVLQRPTEGQILIDDHRLESLDLEDWRNQIGYVPQEMFLFHESVRTNVTLRDPSFDSEAVIAALRQAGAGDFVADLRDGMDTVIGERGTMLSGGQRQRIAIARALVRKPSLIILDEATAGLDPDTERAIWSTLKALTPGVTILAISHQAAVVDVADRIYRLQNGQLHREK